jgi:hypothetical protein
MPGRRMVPYRRPRRAAAALTGLALAYKYRKFGSTGNQAMDAIGKRAYAAGRAVGRVIKRKMVKKSGIHQKALPNIPGHGAGGTYSAFRLQRRLSPWLKGLRKNAASNFKYVNSGYRIGSTVGQQAITSVAQTFNYQDLQGLFQTTVNKSCRTILESCTENTIFRNQDKNDVYLDLYDIVARRDITSTGNTDFYPDGAWANGVADAGASNMQLQVGTTPFSSPRFTQLYKVVKVTHVILPAGGTHEHRVHYEPNRMLNLETLQDGQWALKGLTHYTMAVWYAAPLNDSVNTGQVSIGAANLDYVQTKQYKWTYIQDAVTNNTFTQSLPTAFTTAANVMQDESGTIVTDAAA